MSQDENLLVIASACAALLSWGYWFAVVLQPGRLTARTGIRTALLVCPLAAMALLFTDLTTLAAPDVRGVPLYESLYMLFGAGWVGLFAFLARRAGIDLRDDALERRNAAATWALSGGVVGLTLCFAGSNIGAGPGWWVVLFCAAVSTASLVLVWWGLHLMAGTPEVITVGREISAGVRVAGLLVATGLVFGRAAAGDWQGWVQALVSYGAVAWMGAALAVVGMLVERLLAPSADDPQRPVVTHGLLPALAYVGTAAGFVLWLGPP
jgi:hypothetical protein